MEGSGVGMLEFGKFVRWVEMWLILMMMGELLDI